ncbi:MAG TPA: hypothetical protein VH374_17945 [Polyangia bacterium]|jgi:hypothetical protein|nr:hypothetical protein [Polyangia bacterium]
MEFVRGTAIVVTFGLLVAASPAAADDPEALIHQGNDLRRKGDDLRAEGYIKRAYEIAHTPRAAAQVGLVELALRSYVEAEQYLAEALAAPDRWVKENADVLEKALGQARAHLLRVEIVGAPPRATITTAARAPVKLDADRMLWLPPGDHALRVEAPGYEVAIVSVSGAAAETRRVLAKMQSERPPASDPAGPPVAPPVAAGQLDGTGAGGSSPAVPDSTREGRGRGLRWAGIGVGAVGAAAAAVGATLAIQGTSKRNSIENAAGMGGPYNPADGNWQTLERAGVGLIVGGGVLVAGGVTMFLLGRSSGSAAGETNQVAVSIAGGRGFGFLQCQRRF